jgi:hypothetical protein
LKWNRGLWQSRQTHWRDAHRGRGYGARQRHG